MPPIQYSTTPTDHIPEEFSVDDLKSHGFTDEEIKALATGTDDDPALFDMPEEGQAAAGEDDDDGEGVQIGTEPAAQQQRAPEPQQQKLPEVDIPDTTDAEKVVAEAEEKLNALHDQYDNGELTKAEFQAQQAAVLRAQVEAQMIIESASKVVDQAKQSVVQQFYAAQDAYYKAHGADALLSEEHVDAWDAQLRAVTANPALATLTFDQMISLAHKRYADEYEIINGKPLPVPPPKAGTTQGQPRMQVRSEADRPEAIQTLARVNGDLSDAISDSRTAVLDQLAMKDPIKAEEQLMQMTPDEEERWLRSA